MLKTAFITENKIYIKFLEKERSLNFFSFKDYASQKAYKECDCVIIDIIQIAEKDLENLLQQSKDCKKIIVISSVPYNYLPYSYKNILSSYKVKFTLIPFTTNDFINEIQFNGEKN